MKYLYLNKHWQINKEYDLDKLLFLMIDRPNEINVYDDYMWLNINNNRYNRNYDLPSFVCFYSHKTCSLSWCKNEKNHREKVKPAYISHDGIKEYLLNDQLIKKEYPK